MALPALAAASLTVAAAGTAFATDSVPEAKTSHQAAGAMDTTQWTRDGAQTASRSSAASRSAVAKARASAAAKAKSRAAAAGRAQTAKDAAARKAALGVISASDSTMSSYNTPEPKVAATAKTDAPTDDAPESSVGGGWVRPLIGGTYTSGYGYRWGRMHLGNDFATPVGTPLRAMNDAQVVAVGFYGGMGLRVQIRFDNGVEAVYAHMSRATVSVGDHLASGERLGFSGNTGNSTGPHLHLEIHINGEPTNPAPWLRAHGLI
ncbi:M23 family metallopeptidase [Luteipulveratus mongoliensis]|uniref:M23 family metallopeptidase n=1 Tax=Luteipulveratus mongoliensis TaxID=571913 RepID=UPI0006970551|nr:M23 family metallopeptidase [Luteipulveratus mongoliensis]